MSDTALELLRLCGVLGCLGSFTIMVTDWWGWTRASDHENYTHDTDDLDISPLATKIFGRSRGISWERRRPASIIGAIAMPFAALGFIPMAALLEPAGLVLACVTAFSMSLFLFGGVMAHAAMGLINGLFDSLDEVAKGTAEFAVVKKHIGRALSIYQPITFALVVGGSLVGSLLYSYAVFFAGTLYPVWMGFLNIFLIAGSFQLALWPLPFAVARWTNPACVHLFATFPFHLVTTILIWNLGA